MGGAQTVEGVTARGFLLKGDNLAQALHRIDRVGAQLAGRLARARAEPVNPLAEQQGRATDDH